ncbi:MAG: hypothetical protein QM779_01485 [Propionicimonas sp.]|uniref:hypothetical protein n=1 Tax=Propionicimonas sp. TaxID=1955623 RepID=UPI003D0F2AE2
MSVHVGEIHTELTAGGAAAERPAGPDAPEGERRPGARDDQWRLSQARVRQLGRRVRAEDSDD